MLIPRRLPYTLIFILAIPIASYAGMSKGVKDNSNFSGLYVGGGIGANSTTFSSNNNTIQWP